MSFEMIAIMVFAAVAFGGFAYVLIYPLLSGERRAEKRQQTFGNRQPRKGAERVVDGQQRRKQLADSLKELEAKQKNQKVSLDTRIAQAGLTWDKKRFVLVSVALAAVFGLLFFVGSGMPLAGLCGLIVGGLGAPRWLLGYLKARRIKAFMDEFPNAMDVIVRGIKSGLPLNDCMRIIASEARDPVKSEFRQLVESQALGLSVGDACGKLFERVPVAEANFFAIVIQIQQKAGGNLSEALGNLSRVIRERRKMKGKVAAMSMEARASAAIIASLPFVVTGFLWVSSPNYIELLWKTQSGKIALAISGCWMLVGLFTMKKMIDFDI
jgi:tight adherence protein B